MRTGTFMCWLWGHKFRGKDTWYKEENPDIMVTRYSVKDYCVRCGLSNKEKRDE